MDKQKILKIAAPLILVILVFFFFSRDRIEKQADSDLDIQEVKSNDSLDSYYQKALSLRGPDYFKSEVNFLAVGDIMLSRNVADTVLKSANANLPFEKMANVFESVDFSFGNLETPVAEKNPTVGGHSLVFNSPQELVAPLRNYGFQILNLANNHALDKGLAGLNFTKTFLDDLGIKYTGSGENLEQAWQPAVVEAEDIKICFIGASYTSINDNGKTSNNYVARTKDLDNLKLAIQNSQNICDFVVATMHAGTEYKRNPNQDQINFARSSIDFGADMVIGAHPHWIQTTEKYKEKYIFYSLGNFIFDQEWSRETKEGLALKIKLSKNKAATIQGSAQKAKLDSVELIPVIIENYSTPRPATADEAKNILEKIGLVENILK